MAKPNTSMDPIWFLFAQLHSEKRCELLLPFHPLCQYADDSTFPRMWWNITISKPSNGHINHETLRQHPKIQPMSLVQAPTKTRSFFHGFHAFGIQEVWKIIVWCSSRLTLEKATAIVCCSWLKWWARSMSSETQRYYANERLHQIRYITCSADFACGRATRWVRWIHRSSNPV